MTFFLGLSERDGKQRKCQKISEEFQRRRSFRVGSLGDGRAAMSCSNGSHLPILVIQPLIRVVLAQLRRWRVAQFLRLAHKPFAARPNPQGKGQKQHAHHHWYKPGHPPVGQRLPLHQAGLGLIHRRRLEIQTTL